MEMHFEVMTVGNGGKQCLSVRNVLIESSEGVEGGEKEKERAKRRGLAAAVARERREKMATCCTPRSPKDHALS
jgi:hypothetical protein